MGKEKFIATVYPCGIRSINGTTARLRFSLGFNLNTACDDLNTDPPSPNHSANVVEFFTRLAMLKQFVDSKSKINVLYNGQPYAVDAVTLDGESYFRECNGNVDKVRDIRNHLWQALFFASQDLDGSGLTKISDYYKDFIITDPGIERSPKPVIGEPLASSLAIVNTIKDKITTDTLKSSSFLTREGMIDHVAGLLSTEESKLSQQLSNISRASGLHNDIVRQKSEKFVNNIAATMPTLTGSLKSALQGAESEAAFLEQMLNFDQLLHQNYASTYINIPVAFNIYSLISNHPLLMRVMGLISDFEITVPLSDQTFRLCAYFDDGSFVARKDFIFSEVVFDKCTLRSKIAYLPQAHGNSFHWSVLKDKGNVHLMNIDVLAKEQDLQALKEKVQEEVPENIVSETLDAFNRGILYNHNSIKDLVDPEDPLPRPLNLGGGQTIQVIDCKAEFLTNGERVATRYTGKYRSLSWQSLTQRSTHLSDIEGENVLRCDSVESAIHYDHVMHSMDDSTGKEQQVPSPTLFEYKGELLTLNSIFSRATKKRRGDDLEEELENPADPYQVQAEERIKKALSIEYFPRKQTADAPERRPANLYYGFPVGSKIPRLIFNNEYQFVLYHEFQNGWGLPLLPGKGMELSVSEIYDSRQDLFGVRPFKYANVEHHKPVAVFSTVDTSKFLPVEDKMDDPDKESLHSLVLYNKNDAQAPTRAILPPMASMEHIYRHGMLFEMQSEERLMWKHKYNCTFKDKNEYTSKGKCDEGCKNYCGGLRMTAEEYLIGSVNDQIKANYLPDPAIKGFSIRLFWDKVCRVPVGQEMSVTFPRNSITDVYSYTLRLGSCSPERGVEVFADEEHSVLYVNVKPGMSIYAKLFYADENLILGFASEDFWINQLASNESFSLTSQRFTTVENPKNRWVTLKLTHAMKKPLIPPVIKTLSSGADPDANDPRVTHVREWLSSFKTRLESYRRLGVFGSNFPHTENEFDYILKENFDLEKNIVDRRKSNEHEEGLGGTIAVIRIKAVFERLDAKGNNTFIEEIVPTGALELLQRTEEFSDNPEDVSFTADDGRFTYHPERPLRPLSLDTKTFPFAFHHRLELRNDILYQAKSSVTTTSDIAGLVNEVSHPDEKINTRKDPFRQHVSTLAFDMDVRSDKFEIREYMLRNISKYKGFFTASPQTDMAEYSELSRPLKVMMLNNQRPPKPEVAFTSIAITAEKEVTHHLKGRTIKSTQKANTLVVYLKRGRNGAGKHTRVGVLVDCDSVYSQTFRDENLLSSAGRDIVSDRSSLSDRHLAYRLNGVRNVVIPPLENNPYDAAFDQELSIVHYLPKFDEEHQLWKFEIEFELRYDSASAVPQFIHNAFINLSLVHYQPLSINYNANNGESLASIRKDCRLSEVQTSIWSYLLPERKLSVYFDKPNLMFDRWGEVALTLTYDSESLHYFDGVEGQKPMLRSNFIATIEGSDDQIMWQPVMSQLINDDGTEGVWQLMHPLIRTEPPERSIVKSELRLRFRRKSIPAPARSGKEVDTTGVTYKKFRMRLIEVEWFVANVWTDVHPHMDKDILDNENLRVRYIELIS